MNLCPEFSMVTFWKLSLKALIFHLPDSFNLSLVNITINNLR